LAAGCGGRQGLDVYDDAATVSVPGVEGGTASPPLITDCRNLPWMPKTLTSVDEVPALLAGQWMKCGGAEPVNLKSPFELTDDGRRHDPHADQPRRRAPARIGRSPGRLEDCRQLPRAIRGQQPRRDDDSAAAANRLRAIIDEESLPGDLRHRSGARRPRRIAA